MWMYGEEEQVIHGIWLVITRVHLAENTHLLTDVIIKVQ